MRRLFIAVLGCALVGSVTSGTPVAAHPPRPSVSRAEVHTRPEALGVADRHPTHAAQQQLTRHAAAWGISAGDFAATRVVGIGTAATVRFDQRIHGLRALGGYAALTVTPEGALVSDVVRTLPAPESAAPVWSRPQARAAARHVVAGATGIGSVEPVVVDGGVVPAYGDTSQYAWLVAVSGATRGPATALVADGSGEVLWVSGSVRHAAGTPMLCDYRDAVLDPLAKPQAADDYPLCATTIAGDNYTPRTNDPAPAAADMARLQTGIDETLSYYATTLGATSLGRDAAKAPATADVTSWEYLGNIAPALNVGVANAALDPPLTKVDDCDLPIADPRCAPRVHALISACDEGVMTCGLYDNAYWDAWPSQRCDDPTSLWSEDSKSLCGAVYFGRGWAVGDVVAHELTHGVTAYEFPYAKVSAETDALAEAFSDFIAEAVDQTDVTPGEAPDAAWKFGEDVLPAYGGQSASYLRAYGAFRTMRASLPGEYQRITSKWNRFADPHYNLGPADRFAWLIANGGSQGGYTVKPLGTTPWRDPDRAGVKSGLCATDPVDTCTGIRRMSVLVMSALPLMPAPTPTYFDFGRAVVVACQTLAAVPTEGFNAASCAQVTKALLATRILNIKFTSSLTSLGSVASGTTVNVSASLKTSTKAYAASVPVRFQMRTSRRGAWVTLATGTTSTTGRANFTVTLARSAYYRITTVKSASVPYVVTRTRHVRVY